MRARSTALIRRVPAVAGAAAALAALWILAGIRTIDPASEFAVVARLGGAPRATGARLVVAPVGFSRLTRWPANGVSVPLPGAERLRLPGRDGSRFGLRGTAVLRARRDHPRELAAAGDLRAALAAALARSADVLVAAEADRAAPDAGSHTIASKLGKELEAEGVDLDSLRIDGFDRLRASGDVAPLPRDVRVLVVGLDGADWAIVDPLIEAGRMPHLARIIREGVRAKFLSINPMLSPVVWTSIATGVEPRRHGVMDFLAPAAGGASEPVTSRARRVPAIWELLSRAGASVGVTGWWATWPASAVDGYLVTDRVAYQLFGYASDPRSGEGKTWPPGLYEKVRPLIVPPDAIPWDEIVPYLDGGRRTPDAFDADERALLDEFRTLLASGRTYLDVALALRRESTPRFEAVYFEGTDTVGHLFMPYRLPKLPSVPAGRVDSFHDVVDRYYETADRMLGRLLDGRDGWVVLVCSDHGFVSDGTRPQTTDSRIGHGAAADWHRRFGVFAMSGPGIRAGVRLDEVSVYDVAPTVLALFGQPVPASWPGRVIGEAFAPERFRDHPVLFREDPPPLRPDAPDEAPGDDAEARELREKLQSLGYVSSEASSPMTTWNNRGVASLADGRYAEAAEAFRQAIAEEPAQPTLWVNLGIALRFSGRGAEARVWLEKAFASPSTLRAAGHQLAQLDLEAGRLDAAERTLRAVLAREPGAAEVFNSLGIVLERQGRLAEATRAYETAARLDPNAAEPRNNLGNIAKQARRDDEAEAWYRRAIDADPYFMGAYNNLALLYQDRGAIARAIDLYDRALSKAPRNAVVLNNLASLYYATGDLESARDTWRRAAEADPGYASPRNNLAGLALAEGDDATAARLLDEALTIDPKYGDALVNLSILERRRGDGEAARRALERATADPRAAATAWRELGIFELGAGRPAVAARALARSAELAGDRPEILNALGEALARSGDRIGAVNAWRQSLAVDPNQEQVRSALSKLEKQE